MQILGNGVPTNCWTHQVGASKLTVGFSGFLDMYGYVVLS